MAFKLIEIDDSCRTDHWYLDDKDQCYCFGEYTAREGYAYSETNQLIINLKKSVDRKGKAEYRYKTQAIRQVGHMIKQVVNLPDVTFVPVPPSKSKSDPLYDDRLCQILEVARGLDNRLDYCEMVTQPASFPAVHDSDDRPSPDELFDRYQFQLPPNYQPRHAILILDDVLTTGSHYRAVKRAIEHHLPDRQVVGLFVARRVPKTIDPAMIFTSLDD
jgi:hypothetical protein